jgi:hypothetical protein
MHVDAMPRPAIRDLGRRPVTNRRLVVNLAVADLQRSIDFFEAIGFNFDPGFTDASCACMLVGRDAVVCLLSRALLGTFLQRAPGDPTDCPTALYAIEVGARSDVDPLIARAHAAGATDIAALMDGPSMYARCFRDPDGYAWEVYWIVPEGEER